SRYHQTGGIHRRLPGLCSGRTRSPDQRSGSTSGGVKMIKTMRASMRTNIRTYLLAAAAILALGAGANAQQANMTFFVTSAGSGNGANLGGIAGADKHCQDLAAAAGAGSHTWRAYLSTQGDGAVNARDRIGSGPWKNAKGDVVAKS